MVEDVYPHSEPFLRELEVIYKGMSALRYARMVSFLLVGAMLGVEAWAIFGLGYALTSETIIVALDTLAAVVSLKLLIETAYWLVWLRQIRCLDVFNDHVGPQMKQGLLPEPHECEAVMARYGAHSGPHTANGAQLAKVFRRWNWLVRLLHVGVGIVGLAIVALAVLGWTGLTWVGPGGHVQVVLAVAMLTTGLWALMRCVIDQVRPFVTLSDEAVLRV